MLKKKYLIFICTIIATRILTTDNKPINIKETTKREWDITAGLTNVIKDNYLSDNIQIVKTDYGLVKSSIKECESNQEIIYIADEQKKTNKPTRKKKKKKKNKNGKNIKNKSYKIYELPEYSSYRGFKSYEPYTAITATGSPQYKLQQYADTNEYGLREVDGRICVALGSYFDIKIGQYFDLILENGTVIKCILGDEKADCDTDSSYHIYTTSCNCCSEFLVSTRYLYRKAKQMGDISYIHENWKSPVEKVKVYENNFLN